MDASRQSVIRQEARRLLAELWKKREDLWNDSPDPLTVTLRAPEAIASVLGFRIEKVQEIPQEPTALARGELVVATAGLIDRQQRRIVIAQKYQLPWQRFTLGHELGHAVLHEDILLHRDLPLQGGERANGQRPVKEREADLFAAEILMPTKPLTREFAAQFGGPLDGRRPDANLAQRLSIATARKLSEFELARTQPMQRALLVARAYGGADFSSLHERFKVSPTAMAIQLLDLGLVR